MHSHILERRIFGKPFTRPIVCGRARLAPCLPGTAAEAVHENEVDKGLQGRVEEVQSEGAFRIVHVIVGDGGGPTEETRARCKCAIPGREGGCRRQVGALALRISYLLCKIQPRS